MFLGILGSFVTPKRDVPRHRPGPVFKDEAAPVGQATQATSRGLGFGVEGLRV